MRADRWRKISLLTELITIIFHLLSADPGCRHSEVPQLYSRSGPSGCAVPAGAGAASPDRGAGGGWTAQTQTVSRDGRKRKGDGGGGVSDPRSRSGAEQPQGLPTDGTRTDLIAALAPSRCCPVA